VPVHDLVIKGNDLAAATHGRAFWVLDNLTALRQLTPDVAKASVRCSRRVMRCAAGRWLDFPVSGVGPIRRPVSGSIST